MNKNYKYTIEIKEGSYKRSFQYLVSLLETLYGCKTNKDLLCNTIVFTPEGNEILRYGHDRCVHDNRLFKIHN